MATTVNNNNIESKNQSVYVTVSNGIVQDVFPNRDMAIKDMHRHVYNTLVGCCGGKVEGDGETCCVVSYQGKEQNDICMVVPFDPNNRDHREAYNAQRSIWHLPELPAITEAEGIKVGTEVWTTIELHSEYGKRGKVVRKYFADHGVWCLDIEFEDGTTACYAEEYVTTEKPWAVVGAKCRHKYLDSDVVLTITAVGQYYGIKAESEDGKVKRCDLVSYFEPVEELTEAEGIKVGDKVRHNKHDEVATVTAIREVFVNRCDGYRYLYTLDFGQPVFGPFHVDLNGGEFLREAFTPCTPDGRDLLPEPPKEIIIEDTTFFDEQSGKAERQNSGEIKPRATDSELESLTAKYAKQIEESALLGCGCMVGDGDESRKDSKCVKVRTAYKNDSHDAKDWTYCVSWYETATIKGDADGRHQTLRECENGILLEQAARHMAYFELMARKGWTLDEILYGKAA